LEQFDLDARPNAFLRLSDQFVNAGSDSRHLHHLKAMIWGKARYDG
jgi:hypothetical protein